ncbi:sugar phosphate isomerase/epimerase family protein [Rubrolithibacter danxiaensis]|uniref:sugar phosphate isomerase/epimerase family protein n=1 Tax=Rubrolithibacter danxiaensis TaxID=3390805 RepID=UPI003BF7D5CA
MRISIKLLIAQVFVFFALVNFSYAQRPESKLGWQLGAQAWTFRQSTFAETLDTLKSIEVDYLQGFNGQKLGGGIDGNMDFHMDAATREKVLELLKQKGIKMVSFGVVSANSDDDWRQLFEFIKGMGLKQFATEPDPKFIPLVAKLADEYEINVAIHDHPRPTRYWSPDTVLKYIGASKRLGACADIGHWVRSGLDPVQCLKKLEGHIFELHFKDLDRKPSEEMLKTLAAIPAGGQWPKEVFELLEKGPHDVHWGNGVSNISGVMKELKRQGFKGPIFAEYEYNWGKNAADVAASAKYFRSVAKKL